MSRFCRFVMLFRQNPVRSLLLKILQMIYLNRIHSFPISTYKSDILKYFRRRINRPSSFVNRPSLGLCQRVGSHRYCRHSRTGHDRRTNRNGRCHHSIEKSHERDKILKRIFPRQTGNDIPPDPAGHHPCTASVCTEYRPPVCTHRSPDHL